MAFSSSSIVTMELGGLAITGIIFGSLEILGAIGVGIVNGSGVIGTNSILLAYDDCLTCLQKYGPSFSYNCYVCGNSVKNPVSLNPVSLPSDINTAVNVTTWLTYAFGATVVTSAVNIALCALSMKFIKVLNSMSPGQGQAEVSRNPISAWN